MDSTFLKSDYLGYSHNPIVFFSADNLCQTTDHDFRKGAARKVSAVLKSDLEAIWMQQETPAPLHLVEESGWHQLLLWTSATYLRENSVDLHMPQVR